MSFICIVKSEDTNVYRGLAGRRHRQGYSAVHWQDLWLVIRSSVLLVTLVCEVTVHCDLLTSRLVHQIDYPACLSCSTYTMTCVHFIARVARWRSG